MKAVLALLCCLVAVPAFSQTNPILSGQAFTGTFEHDGVNVTGFRCYVDGKPTSELPATARACVFPGQSVGSHEVAVSAVNAFGESPKLTATVTVGTPPDAPTNLQITMAIAVKPDGTAELLAFHVQKQ